MASWLGQVMMLGSVKGAPHSATLSSTPNHCILAWAKSPPARAATAAEVFIFLFFSLSILDY